MRLPNISDSKTIFSLAQVGSDLRRAAHARASEHAYALQWSQPYLAPMRRRPQAFAPRTCSRSVGVARRDGRARA
jgi:hypothetical protein